MRYDKPKFLLCGETALAMEFGDEISEEINAQIRNTILAIEKLKLEEIVELVPTYRSILVQYDPLKIEYEALINKLENLEIEDVQSGGGKVKLIEIPTVYSGEYAPDIEYVASHNEISVDEVIKIHTGTDYLVYMMGFIPGFTYLGGMSEKIATPRLEVPRTKIIGGSVGIAGSQTGMYPSDSPGGWQIIGRTPLQLFDAKKEPPVFINAGDYIRYVAIDENEYERIESEVKNNTYEVVSRMVERSELK